MKNFAEEMKALDKAKKEERLNPDIEAWKEKQRNLFENYFKCNVLRRFKWHASDGNLKPIEDVFYGGETEHIPNALEMTEQILKETFEPYGIKVENVTLSGDRGKKVTATFIIE